MLNRIETRIMEYLFTKCRGKRTVLISPDDILKNVAAGKQEKVIRKFEITRKQLETHMKNIVLDGYLDYSSTNDKGGKMLYVVTLTTRGEAFRRERDEIIRRRWHSIGWKVLLTLIAFGVSSLMWYLIGLVD